MGHEELKEIGIHAFGHRHKILKAVKEKLSGLPELGELFMVTMVTMDDGVLKYMTVRVPAGATVKIQGALVQRLPSLFTRE